MLYDSGTAYLEANPAHLADLRVLLTTSSYTPDVGHASVADVTGELAGGGYARRPVQNLRVVDAALLAADVAFPDLELAAGQPRYAVVYVEGAADATRTLLAWYDLGASAAIPAGTAYFIRWPARGLVVGL